jgi:hypothetical protein
MTNVMYDLSVIEVFHGILKIVVRVGRVRTREFDALFQMPKMLALYVPLQICALGEVSLAVLRR